MRNRLLLFCLLGLISANVIAQGSWQWMDLIKGVEDDVSRGIVLDTENNIYVFAQIKGTVSVGGDIFTSFGNFDALLVKFNANGDYQWGLQLGGTDQETPTDIAIDSQNNIYVTGGFKGTAEFNPASPGGAGELVNSNPDALNKNDIFLAKYNSAGTFQWAHQVSTGAHNEFSRSISIDPTGNIVMVGDFKTEIVFDLNDTIKATGSAQDIFVAKVDQTGNTIWFKHFPTTVDNGKFLSIDVAFSDNYYIGGYFEDKLYFENDSAVSSGSSDIILLKLDTNGNVIWVRQGGGSSLDQVNTVITDEAENVYFTGYHSTVAKFDVSSSGAYDSDPLTSKGGYDILFGKYDKLGNLMFVDQIGDVGNDNGYGLTLYQNFVEFSGYYAGMVIVNNDTLTTSGTDNNDVGLFRYDTDGNPLKAHGMSGIGDDRGLSVAIDEFGNSFITGYFQSDTLFIGSDILINANDDLPAKTKDVFMAKYNPSIEVGLTKIQMVSCFGKEDGELIITPFFGTPPFTYNWNHDVGLNDSIASSLSAGSYKVIITDSYMEQDSLSMEITEPDEVITGSISGDTEVLESETVSYSVSGKLNSTFEWEIIGGILLSGQGNDTVSIEWGSIGVGNISVIETDENGCMGNPVVLAVNIGATSISEVNLEQIKIYPNPFFDRAIIEFPNHNHDIYTLTLIDLSGKIVKVITGIKESMVEVVRDELASGYYIIDLRGVHHYRGEIIIE